MAEIPTTPKAFGKALRGSVKSAMPHTLTSMAKTAKKLAPIQIGKEMTLRSKGFISSSIRYQRAKSSHLVSEYGMITRERFGGLAEQEFGRTDQKRKHVPAQRSRPGGNLSRRVSPRSRLKQSTKVISARDLKKKPRSDIEMLAVLRKSKYKGMFILKGSRNIGDGIYRFIGGRKARLEMIHALGDIPQQKKRPWMDHTNERVMREDVGQKRWGRSMTRFLADRVKRLTK